METKNTKYIFISNGYRGGNSTFLLNHINHLRKLKKKIILLDDNPTFTYEYIPKKIKSLKIKTNKFSFSSHSKLKKILISSKGKKKNIYYKLRSFNKIFFYFFLFKK